MANKRNKREKKQVLANLVNIGKKVGLDRDGVVHKIIQSYQNASGLSLHLLVVVV